MTRIRVVFAIFYIGNAIIFGGALLAIAFIPSPKDLSEKTIRIGYSPGQGGPFLTLTESFNASGSAFRVEAVPIESDDLVRAAVEGDLVAVSVDSTIWIDAIDRLSRDRRGRPIVAGITRYATSPAVIAVADFIARDTRSWQTFFGRATGLRWSHPPATTTPGLLTLTAAFSTVSGSSRLAATDVDRDTVRATVRSIDRSARPFDGVDAVVTTEQAVVVHNRNGADRWIAIYPAEGTFWLDFPLALLDRPAMTADRQAAYLAFTAYLRDPAVAQRLRDDGYRPAGTVLSGSLILVANGVDPAQPQTTMPLPSPATLDRILAFSRE